MSSRVICKLEFCKRQHGSHGAQQKKVWEDKVDKVELVAVG